MRCVICDSNDWQNVDEYRDKVKTDGKPIGMSLCKSCGFISYPNKYKSKEEILEHYRYHYRSGPPTFGNFVTGSRKLQYHGHFLKEVFAKWQDNGVDPVVGECGSAIGMVLNMVKQNFPKGEYHGTELTVDFRKVAWHEFQIRLGEELPQDRSYDLLMTYKVAEHQLDIDMELALYHKLLKPDGYLYISVPTWFNELCNFGTGGFDLGYYYHPDHINVWTKKLFESLLKKTGFQIIKFDDYMYGETYLCKKTEPQKLTKDDFEKPDEILELLAKVKKAAELFGSNKFEEAVELWPKFPVAWRAWYEHNRDKIHRENDGDGKAVIASVVDRVTKALGVHSEVHAIQADLQMRYGQYKEAICTIEESLLLKPNNASAMMQMAHAFRQLSDTTVKPDDRIRYRLAARDLCRAVVNIDQSARTEAYNWSLVDDCALGVDETIDYLLKLKEAEQKVEPAEEKSL